MKHTTCSCPNPKTIGFNESIGINTYLKFDQMVNDELKNRVTANEIVNKSKFCTNAPLGFLNNDSDDVITIDDLFHGLKNRKGMYQLWVGESGYCDTHNVFPMRCVYTGKGKVLKRAKEHIEEKWLAESNFYISFYDCENRIAKYLEQAFLDIYKCDMNKHENPGKEELFGYWSRDRYEIGTETPKVADRLASKFRDSAVAE